VSRGSGGLDPTWAPLRLPAFPLIVLFFLAQRQFIEGITLTGLKGV